MNSVLGAASDSAEFIEMLANDTTTTLNALVDSAFTMCPNSDLSGISEIISETRIPTVRGLVTTVLGDGMVRSVLDHLDLARSFQGSKEAK